MHVHGMFHDGLYANPDLIALHTSGYQRFYSDGSIFNLFGEIFFGRDVIFLGTQLSEPEMVRFFQGLQEYFAGSGARRSRNALALIETKADLIEPSIDGINQMNEVLRQERSSDTTSEQTMGIARARFFKKDGLYAGLTDVLRIAFGESMISPPPQPPWQHAF